MNKEILLACALLLSSPLLMAGSAQAAAKEVARFDPVPSFQEMVSKATRDSNWSDVYQIPKNKKWVRRFHKIDDVKYDVKKTDSLVSPVVGIVSFKYKRRISDFFETETEAINARAASARDFGVDISAEGNYVPTERGWQLKQFSYTEASSDGAVRLPVVVSTEIEIRKMPSIDMGAVLQRFLP